MQKNDIRRKLDESALEQALLELNQDFILQEELNQKYLVVLIMN